MTSKKILGAIALPCLVAAGLGPWAMQAASAQQARAKPSHTHHFSLSGKNDTYEEEGVEATVNLSAAQSEGRISFQDECWPSGYFVPAHYHQKHAEVFYIVSGKVQWTVGGETHEMGAGDLVYIPPNTVHTVKVTGKEKLRTLMLYEPGGYEEYRFNEVLYNTANLADPRAKARIRQTMDFNAVEGVDAVAPPKVSSHMHFFALKGRGQNYREGNLDADVLLSAVQSEGRMSFQDEIWPTDMVVPAHFHKKHAEIFYIVSGKVEWTVGGETRVMGSGDLVYIPPNTVHSVKVVGNEKLQTLMIYEPGGYEEYRLNEAAYTKEQLEMPEVKAKLRELSDFNVVEQ